MTAAPTRFKGAVVVVTGGSSGIGAELIKQLTKAGATAITFDRAATNSDTTYTVDMLDVPAVEKAIDDVFRKHGKVDYFFNNAGIFLAGEQRDTPLGYWHEVATNNILSVMNGTQLIYQRMLEQGSGHIINVASATGLMPIPGMGIYGSTKFAIVGLNHELYAEAKPLGIDVSVVCPTIIDTPLYDTAKYGKVQVKKALSKRTTFQTPDIAAHRILKGVAKKKHTIHTAFSTKVGSLTYRFSPSVYLFIAQRIMRTYRTTLRDNS